MPPRDTRLRDAIALTIAFFLPLALAYLYFVVLAKPPASSDDIPLAGEDSNPSVLRNISYANMAIGIGKAIQFLLPVGYVWWFERDMIGLPLRTWRGIPLGIAFALVVGGLMFPLWFGVVRDIPGVADESAAQIRAKVAQFHADSPERFLVMAIVISVFHSLAEEYYWRWFIFGWMRRHMPTALAVVVSAIGFMLHHIVILGVYFPGNFWLLAIPFSVCVGVGGGFWCWLYARSGSLYATWLSHCLVDAAIMGIGWIVVSG